MAGGRFRFAILGLVRRFLNLFQGWIFFQLLPDRVYQLKPGQLQQLDRHLELRRHDELLGQFELLSEFNCHLRV